jgi:hypothetical protein
MRGFEKTTPSWTQTHVLQRDTKIYCDLEGQKTKPIKANSGANGAGPGRGGRICQNGTQTDVGKFADSSRGKS